ncbi:hypothetical protein RND71_002129 [Anisodus tanguticus]|uniref:Uncharacterized protein n=1 Tax=Anisodus tanguticus TaxID=243964 RepID=A0AAE1T3D1_9SOLA|nr:hypothetical protein RND71_002129 [Anisodus tanguticus]
MNRCLLLLIGTLMEQSFSSFDHFEKHETFLQCYSSLFHSGGTIYVRALKEKGVEVKVMTFPDDIHEHDR